MMGASIPGEACGSARWTISFTDQTAHSTGSTRMAVRPRSWTASSSRTASRFHPTGPGCISRIRAATSATSSHSTRKTELSPTGGSSPTTATREIARMAPASMSMVVSGRHSSRVHASSATRRTDGSTVLSSFRLPTRPACASAGRISRRSLSPPRASFSTTANWPMNRLPGACWPSPAPGRDCRKTGSGSEHHITKQEKLEEPK